MPSYLMQTWETAFLSFLASALMMIDWERLGQVCRKRGVKRARLHRFIELGELGFESSRYYSCVKAEIFYLFSNFGIKQRGASQKLSFCTFLGRFKHRTLRTRAISSSPQFCYFFEPLAFHQPALDELDEHFQATIHFPLTIAVD